MQRYGHLWGSVWNFSIGARDTEDLGRTFGRKSPSPPQFSTGSNSQFVDIVHQAGLALNWGKVELFTGERCPRKDVMSFK